MALNRDEIQVIADQYYDQSNYDTPVERAFALLVDVAGHVYQTYMEEDVPNTDDPDSFKPSTWTGEGNGVALVQGLVENLEINFPDGRFRD
jgi:hypothetical protein